jgi:hypothetical protein
VINRCLKKKGVVFIFVNCVKKGSICSAYALQEAVMIEKEYLVFAELH